MYIYQQNRVHLEMFTKWYYNLFIACQFILSACVRKGREKGNMKWIKVLSYDKTSFLLQSKKRPSHYCNQHNFSIITMKVSLLAFFLLTSLSLADVRNDLDDEHKSMSVMPYLDRKQESATNSLFLLSHESETTPWNEVSK